MINPKTADLYEILGISPEATLDEIRHAYHLRALQYHPDKNPHDEIHARFLFELAGEAYRILSSNVHRDEYIQGEDGRSRHRQQNSGFGENSQVTAISKGQLISIQTFERNPKQRTFEEWLAYFLNEVQVDIGIEELDTKQFEYEMLGRKFLTHLFSVRH